MKQTNLNDFNKKEKVEEKIQGKTSDITGDVRWETDPNKRCIYCNGREVKSYLHEKLISNSLEMFNKDEYRCKNGKECDRNIINENTQLIVRTNGFQIVDENGKNLIEVTFKNDII